MCKKKLSIIIPIKVTYANRFLLKRVENLLQAFSKFKNIDIVVVDSSSSKRYAQKIEKLCKERASKYTFLEMIDIYSASKARNHGSKEAEGDYLLFYDVDLVVEDDFLLKVLEDIEELKSNTFEAFTLYPCFYLTEEKTKKIEEKNLEHSTFREIKEHYLKGYNDEVSYLAVNTSTILVNREHFFNIGAYSEHYKGHGYEDFELIHRLYLSYPIVSKGDDYALDFKTPFPALYRGFRKYFAYYALPNLFNERYTLHLWHPRPLTKKYYRQRDTNLEFFLQDITNTTTIEVENAIGYSDFIHGLLKQYGYLTDEYCGLYDLNSISKNQKPKYSIKRKIRRKFLNILEKYQSIHQEENSVNYTISKQLIKNTRNFINIKHYSLLNRLLNKRGTFYGWGRKKSGKKAMALAKKQNSSFVLLEDGFIRSLGLGVNGSPSFSLVEDNIGIYYDATTPSKLENILNEYDFKSDEALGALAKDAMAYMREHHISKYNDAPNIDKDYFKDESKDRVLIVAQTNGDSSLEYGLGHKFSTKEMIEDAFRENPNASVYLKIHPDVLSGKKASDISLDEIPKACKIIDENINPISLLKHFKKVYTKTSGMGMEALILGIDVVCYGMPFYAGWGLIIEKQVCKRRTRVLTLEELFAGAYILYTKYHNPYEQRESDIMDTMREIDKQRTKNKN